MGWPSPQTAGHSSCSRLNNYLYSYSLPDLKLVGSAELGGKGAGWAR
jgi:hypothetical protein